MFTPEKLAEINRHFDVEDVLTTGQVDALIKSGSLFCTSALLDFEGALSVFGKEWLEDNAPFEGYKMFGGTALSPTPLIVANGWEIDRLEAEAGIPATTGIYVPAGFAAAALVMKQRGFNEIMDGPLCASTPEDEYDQTSLN